MLEAHERDHLEVPYALEFELDDEQITIGSQVDDGCVRLAENSAAFAARRGAGRRV